MPYLIVQTSPETIEFANLISKEQGISTVSISSIQEGKFIKLEAQNTLYIPLYLLGLKPKNTLKKWCIQMPKGYFKDNYFIVDNREFTKRLTVDLHISIYEMMNQKRGKKSQQSYITELIENDERRM